MTSIHFKYLTFCLILLTIGIIFCNCQKVPNCYGKDKNSGLIISEVEISKYPESMDKTFIINNDSDFIKIFNINPDKTAPPLDFKIHTLLGCYIEGGCYMKFKRKVSILPDQNAYLYEINYRNCGICKALRFSYNWVIVPKLPENWEVKFKKY